MVVECRHRRRNHRRHRLHHLLHVLLEVEAVVALVFPNEACWASVVGTSVEVWANSLDVVVLDLELQLESGQSPFYLRLIPAQSARIHALIAPIHPPSCSDAELVLPYPSLAKCVVSQLISNSYAPLSISSRPGSPPGVSWDAPAAPHESAHPPAMPTDPPPSTPVSNAACALTSQPEQPHRLPLLLVVSGFPHQHSYADSSSGISETDAMKMSPLSFPQTKQQTQDYSPDHSHSEQATH